MYGKLAVTVVSGGTVGTVGALAATGVPLWLIAAIGTGLVVTGVVTRRLVLRRFGNG